MARPKDPLIKPTEVVATALEVIDRDGLDGFNIRKLALELGVNPSSLYHHFHDKNDILNRVCLLVLDESRVFAPLRVDEGAWQVYVKKSVAYYRRALMRHPNVAPLMTPSGPLGSFGDSLGRRGVTEMLAEGVPTKFIYAIIDSINSLAYGSALLNPQTPDIDPPAGSAPRIEVAGLSEVLKSAPRSPERLFEMQVDALVEGWTAIVEREKAKEATPTRRRKVAKTATAANRRN